MYLYSDDDYSTARSGTLSDFFLSLRLHLSSISPTLHPISICFFHLFFLNSS